MRQVADFKRQEVEDGSQVKLCAVGRVCLSSSQPRIRLRAAEAISEFRSADGIRDVVLSLFNDRPDHEQWLIENEAIDSVQNVA